MRSSPFFLMGVLLFAPFGVAQEMQTQWKRAAVDKTGSRLGSGLVYHPDDNNMYLIGEAKNAPFVQEWLVKDQVWLELSKNGPAGKEPFQAAYQTTIDPAERKIYCLSSDPMKPQGLTLHVFDIQKKEWDKIPVDEELTHLAWHSTTFDTKESRLIVTGSSKKGDQVGWLQTWFYDTKKAKWSQLALPDLEKRKEHQTFVTAREALIDVVGRIRLAWYRDPKGEGTEEERTALMERIESLRKILNIKLWPERVSNIKLKVERKELLDALKEARAMQRMVEELDDRQYPVPSSRRNSPIVYDAKNHVCVLFGGDHEDYLMNDTWILDLTKNTWRRSNVSVAPSQRAGHALVYLPKSGKIALYEGYQQSNSEDYGSRAFRTLNPELWLFDTKLETWEAVDSWKLPTKEVKDKEDEFPLPTSIIHGYFGQYFSPPAIAATHNDTLVLASPDTREISGTPFKRQAVTWTYAIDPKKTSADLTKTLGTSSNTRLYRKGSFAAEFCEVESEPTKFDLAKLEENKWIKFPNPPKNPCQGCRQRDWSTAVWDSDRQQILLWGGGHCVRASSSLAHFSPVSGRMVESYDADEPYGGQGNGGYQTTLWNRPWCDVHNYKHYAYDPKCKLMVSHRGYLYDPERMDWLRQEPYAIPFRPEWNHTALCSTPHGAVAWAGKKTGEGASLWIFDKEKGWKDLEPIGKLFTPYCDSHGLVYDSKRDRLIMSGVGGSYSIVSKGQFLAFDFKTKKLETIEPDNIEYNKTDCARELAYVEHLDWIIIGRRHLEGDPKTGKQYTRIYDCTNNKMMIIDAGPVPDSGGYGAGWMYDTKTKLVYVLNFRGEAHTIKLKKQ